MNLILVIVIIISLIVPSKKALHMFQQNRYELPRYTMWLKDWFKINSKTIIKTSVLLAIAYVSALLVNEILAILIILYFSLNEIHKEMEKKYIKPLVFTMRVYRQIIVMSIVSLITVATAYYLGNTALVYLMLLSPFISYLLIYVMHILTHPIEQLVKSLFINDAKKILASHKNLIKIGITGSYGKTSSKNILQEILSEQFYSLQTPASFNTPMGITITIRENLKNTHEVFIVEMGADKVGEIVELSDFVNPQYAIITSIGPQHLATFKNIENIIKEKMSLVEKLASDGVAIINLDNEYIKNYQIKNNCKVVSYGIENREADYVASNIKYSINGSSFNVDYNNETHSFNTRLLGEHNVLNILSAIALARQLNVSWEKLESAVSKVRFIEHRLQLKTINNRRFIDNAFNSNPEGAAMSLKVISQMPNTRYVITPGMIDLGPIQEEENYKFGYNMLNKVDVAILVGKNQSLPIYNGLIDSGFNEKNIHVFDTVQAALTYVYSNASVDDIILLENDLPDAFSN